MYRCWFSKRVKRSGGAGTWPGAAGMAVGGKVESVGWTGMAKSLLSLAALKSVGFIVSARCPRSGHCQDGIAMAFCQWHPPRKQKGSRRLVTVAGLRSWACSPCQW